MMQLNKAAGRRVATAFALGCGAWARRDYRAWKALGEGGVPWGLRGWVRITLLRMRGRDPFDVARLPAEPLHHLLLTLPNRSERPRVAPHPIPHRQLEGGASPALVAELGELFAEKLARYAPLVEKHQSEYERLHPALFVPAFAQNGKSSNGEVAHFHVPQGSLHCHLSPADARAVVERRWGELHPLSGRAAALPANYTLVYAPRNRQDLTAIANILEAALAWASSTKADPVRSPPVDGGSIDLTLDGRAGPGA